MARGGRVERTSRRTAPSESVVVPFPRPSDEDRLELARLVPAGRSIAVALAVLVAALLAYALARATGTFAVEKVTVAGATDGVARQVKRAIAPALGDSLLSVDLAALEARVEAVPMVRDATLDRAFPHTIAVTVVPEQPATVVRQGAAALLVSDRGRVLRRIERTELHRLPRIWVPSRFRVEPGSFLRGEAGIAAVALAPLASTSFPERIASVRAAPGDLTLKLRSGLELRLGSTSDVRLKLAVGARILELVSEDARYVDVSVPERPVVGTTLDSQVEG